jgi:hypothetical protein
MTPEREAQVWRWIILFLVAAFWAVVYWGLA